MDGEGAIASTGESRCVQDGPNTPRKLVTSEIGVAPSDERERPLELIATELNTLLKRETVDIIKIGGLLVEAKAQLPHGKWLLWIAEHFPLSKSSVANYVRAHRFATEFPNVGNLKVRPSALYMLASGVFNTEEIVILLKKAETEWVDSATTIQIKTKAISPGFHRVLQAKSELKGPPEMSVRPSQMAEVVPARSDPLLREKFATAVLELEKLISQPSRKFVGIIPTNRLKMVCNFLDQVAGARIAV